MIESSFQEAFPEEWVDTHLATRHHDLVILRQVILRQVIPWQRIIDGLVALYDATGGRLGKSLRMMIALMIVSRLRQLSDAQVVAQVQENRYLQYFCNVPDEALLKFVHPSSLCRFRQRLGPAGCAFLEEEVFEQLRNAGVIANDTLLMDSTVLPNHLIHPNDVRLLYQAFGKMRRFSQRHALTLWWDEVHLKKRWRAFGLSKPKERAIYLAELYLVFVPALQVFQVHIEACDASDKERQLLALLQILEEQTQLKLKGEKHIPHRLVSLTEVDARPIKKGKTFPNCEFGTTLQMTFNRQGFMITTDNFIGQPGDATLYLDTLERFEQRMQAKPDTVVTDLGFRSRDNLKKTPESISHVFLGRSEDVDAHHRTYCHKARSATEGFIAVAKNLRGFGKSLYRRMTGDRIWTLCCQTAYNLKKFLQCYREETLSQASLDALGLST